MKDFAPIVLFVYNRPEHTRQTLKALSENELIGQSELYIYSDGPRLNANNEEINKINQVREIIKAIQWTKNTYIIYRKENIGLANSIKTGITEILKLYDKIIVLEDDTMPKARFLKFMNENLNIFNSKVFAGISGYSKGINTSYEDLILTRTGSIWGWGTWRHAWENISFDATFLLSQIEKRNLIDKFNTDINYYEMLKQQEEGKINSWGILFYASYFIKEKYFILASENLIENIGMDGSGTHYNSKQNLRINELFMTLLKKIIK